ncbi:MAG: copper amine oxidase N-terminal domain-containing protein, partial [Peptococcaceae bacterium]|nr:copper amine oxidase N-terminal domain-containing protein [Peptococcaceae bacterium]
AQPAKGDAVYEMYKQYDEITSKYAEAKAQGYPNEFIRYNDLSWITGGDHLSYALVDLANDGTPELVIENIDTATMAHQEYLIDLFGYENGQVQRIFDGTKHMTRAVASYALMENGIIRQVAEPTGASTVTSFYRVAPNGITTEWLGTVEHDTEDAHGYYQHSEDYNDRWAINESDYNSFVNQYDYDDSPTWYPIEDSTPIEQAMIQHRDIAVIVDGQTLDLDQAPIIQNDRTLVPMRAIFEALGASVQWNGADRTITSTKGDTTITLAIGSNTMRVNDQTITLDAPAQITASRTLVPIRAIGEALGADVQWNGTDRSVTVTAK